MNNFVNTRKVSMKVLDSFMNELKVVDGFNTDWAREFGKNPKIGDLIQVRKPYRWTVSDGADLVRQPMDDQFATIRVDRHKHVGFDYSKWDETLSVDDIYDRCFETSIIQLSNQVDDDACDYGSLNINNTSGLLGVDPASLADAQGLFLDAMAGLKTNACTPGAIRAVLSPTQAAGCMKYLNTFFNPTGLVGRQIVSGEIGAAFGFDSIRQDANIRRLTSGVFTGTPVVATSSVDGATTLATSGWTSGDTVTAGTQFTVGSVYNVNPVNRRATSALKKLLITADGTADGAGLLTLQVSCGGTDPLRGPGQYQNVDALPVAAAAITIWAGTPTVSGDSGTVGLAFGKDAFAFVPITFPDPSKEGAWGTTVRDPKTGIALTLAKQFQIGPYETWARIDIGYGFAPLFPDNDGYRILGL